MAGGRRQLISWATAMAPGPAACSLIIPPACAPQVPSPLWHKLFIKFLELSFQVYCCLVPECGGIAEEPAALAQSSVTTGWSGSKAHSSGEAKGHYIRAECNNAFGRQAIVISV